MVPSLPITENGVGAASPQPSQRAMASWTRKAGSGESEASDPPGAGPVVALGDTNPSIGRGEEYSMS